LKLDKKHILILPKWYPYKNDIQLGIFIKNQALLIKDKFNISVIYVQSDSELQSNFEIITDQTNGIFEQVVYFKKSTSVFKKLINFNRYKKAQRLAYANLKLKVDLCHVHVPIRPSFLATKLLKSNHIPFVVTEHWSGHLTGEFENKNSIYKYFYKSVLSKASKISCVSEFLQNKFKQNTGFDTTLLPNFIDKSPTLSNQKSTTNKIDILSVNDMIDAIKNISGIVKAFNIAYQQNPKLHLTLIGGGPDEAKIKTLFTELKIPNSQYSFLGRLDNSQVLKQMLNCDFYISNSNFETFGMTIAEALYAGKPVISTLCGGPNEFLNSDNSLISTIGEYQQLSDLILKMANTFHQYDSMFISNQIDNKYSKPIVIERLEQFYSV